MDLELTGKRCLVAGASRGIGRSIAIALAREGGRVAAIARGEADLRALVGELPGGKHAAIVADVATADGAAAAVDGALAALGGLDIVVANVGKSFAREAAAMDDADFANSLDANLWSTMRVVQRAAPHLAAGAAITMISSIWGREGGGSPGYNVAKAAVISLAKALAKDYGRRGIRVNSVAPGSILFPGGAWQRRMDEDPAAVTDMIHRDLPQGRLGTPDEVADVVAFLSSSRASWVAGACIVVDGCQSHAF